MLFLTEFQNNCWQGNRNKPIDKCCLLYYNACLFNGCFPYGTFNYSDNAQLVYILDKHYLGIMLSCKCRNVMWCIGLC